MSEPQQPEFIHSGDELNIEPNEGFRLVPDFFDPKPQIITNQVVVARVYLTVEGVCSGSVRFLTRLERLKEQIRENDPVIFELPRPIDPENLREEAFKKPYGLPVGFEFDLISNLTLQERKDLLIISYTYNSKNFIGVPVGKASNLKFGVFMPEGGGRKDIFFPHYAPYDFIFNKITFQIQPNT